MKKIKAVVLGLVVALAGVIMPAMLVEPVMAETCPSGSVRSSANTLAECNIPQEDTNNNLMNRLTTIINFVLGVLGFVTVAVIVLGGVQYATSAGDAAKVQKAKNTILYGIVGLIIALLAFAIVNFILKGIFAN